MTGRDKLVDEGPRMVLAGGGHDRCAPSGQGRRNRPADTSGRACDKGDTAFKGALRNRHNLPT
jgi:hypothetical protein